MGQKQRKQISRLRLRLAGAERRAELARDAEKSAAYRAKAAELFASDLAAAGVGLKIERKLSEMGPEIGFHFSVGEYELQSIKAAERARIVGFIAAAAWAKLNELLPKRSGEILPSGAGGNGGER